MKTYIINLERSEKRHEHILAEVKKLGLDFEIVRAIDGGLLSESEIEAIADMPVVSKVRDWLTNRMLATSLSHKKVYETILAQGVDVACVLEDDVQLYPEFVHVLNHLKSSLNGPEVALLHYISFRPLGLSTVNALDLSLVRKLMFPMALDGVGSAAAYVITREAAESLVQNLLPLSTGARQLE